ncbi:hypothetical protein ACS0TY_029721 [Phlomoides rotata]
MKMISYNIRSLGSRIKKREVRDLMKLHKLDFYCIQESKLKAMDDGLSQTLWGWR